MPWPDQQLPPITAEEATRAARRLWRYAMGETWRGPVKLTSGHNHTWMRDGILYVNPNGWHLMVNDLAWLFFRLANPDQRALPPKVRIVEERLIREVVKRGWLNNKLKAREIPADVQFIFDQMKEQNKQRAQLEAGVRRWTTKLNRAQTMLRKYEHKLKKFHQKGKP